jgi:hypothetical protein
MRKKTQEFKPGVHLSQVVNLLKIKEMLRLVKEKGMDDMIFGGF